MAQIYVGIDGGGTKTEVISEDASGKRFEAVYGGSNQHVIGREAFGNLLKKIAEDVAEHYGASRSDLTIVFGGAGVDTETDVKLLKLVSDDLSMKVTYLNDSVIALVANVGSFDGGVVISGTGSIALCMLEGQMHRAGGWGHVIGDEGSGYAIGCKALKLCSKMLDGRKPLTGLVDRVLKHTSTSALDFSDYVNGPNATKDVIASLVPVAVAAEEQGEVEGILDHAVSELYELVVWLDQVMPHSSTLAEYDQDTYPIVLVGGVMTQTPVGRRLMRLARHEGLNRRIFIGEVQPVEGALRLAKKGGSI